MPNTKPHSLSKSRLMAWRQCPKRLWLETYRRDLLEISQRRNGSSTKGIGSAKSRALTPNGILVDTGPDLGAALQLTHDLLNNEPTRPIFEATFSHRAVLVRADMLIPEDAGYRLVEVEVFYVREGISPRRLRDSNGVVQGGGVTLSRVELAYIASDFVYTTDGDYRGFFKHEVAGRGLHRFARCARRPSNQPEPRKDSSGHGHRERGGDRAVADLLNALPYPRRYLDFETIQFAVPIWLNTSPFDLLPFQWSCHTESEDGSLQHTEFLSNDGSDPTHIFCRKLIEAAGDVGPIFVYSAFERTRLMELSNRYPELEEPLAAIMERLVDLLPILRKHYYHPAMKGRFSIKSVLPTIAPDLDYAKLEHVKEGGGAQEAFSEILDRSTSAERRATHTSALLKYCSLDTLAMVRIVQYLQTN